MNRILHKNKQTNKLVSGSSSVFIRINLLFTSVLLSLCRIFMVQV